MFTPSKSSIAEQIADVVENLPEKRQKEILYLAKLQQASISAARLDKKAGKIKGTRTSVAKISKIVNRNRAKKSTSYKKKILGVSTWSKADIIRLEKDNNLSLTIKNTNETLG